MAISKVILDFDGTLTDTQAESAPMIEKWQTLICDTTYMPLEHLLSQIPVAKEQILADKKAGWKSNGVVVAPASSDPYVFHTSILQNILEAFYLLYEIPRPGVELEQFMQKTFMESYGHAITVFRPGAKEFLQHCVQNYDTRIVTNSKTDAVVRKLESIGMPDVPVIGQAKKYVVDHAFDRVPEKIELPSFPRPVYLRRKQYFDILAQFDPKTTAVVGDIFELDLALPEHLHFRTMQLETTYTPTYEKQRHSSGEKTQLATSYDDLIRKLN
ncbi:MAG TPA: HAD family hydrolase [Acidobacteriota bacterium]|nr:HAD family hydrolase [Acidobacteriota bacterium]